MMGRWTRCLYFICCIGLVNVRKLNISKEYFCVPCATVSAERGRVDSQLGTNIVDGLNVTVQTRWDRDTMDNFQQFAAIKLQK